MNANDRIKLTAAKNVSVPCSTAGRSTNWNTTTDDTWPITVEYYLPGFTGQCGAGGELWQRSAAVPHLLGQGRKSAGGKRTKCCFHWQQNCNWPRKKWKVYQWMCSNDKSRHFKFPRMRTTQHSDQFKQNRVKFFPFLKSAKVDVDSKTVSHQLTCWVNLKYFLFT